jgi:hypothetical protein
MSAHRIAAGGLRGAGGAVGADLSGALVWDGRLYGTCDDRSWSCTLLQQTESNLMCEYISAPSA